MFQLLIAMYQKPSNLIQRKAGGVVGLNEVHQPPQLESLSGAELRLLRMLNLLRDSWSAVIVGLHLMLWRLAALFRACCHLVFDLLKSTRWCKRGPLVDVLQKAHKVMVFN